MSIQTICDNCGKVFSPCGKVFSPHVIGHVSGPLQVSYTVYESSSTNTKDYCHTCLLQLVTSLVQAGG